jgi:hypothetical protein
VVHFVCIIPSDAEEVPERTTALENFSADIQDFFAVQLSGKSFSLNDPCVEVIQSEHPTSYFITFASADERLANADEEIQAHLGVTYQTTDHYFCIWDCPQTGTGGISSHEHNYAISISAGITLQSLLENPDLVYKHPLWKISGCIG